MKRIIAFCLMLSAVISCSACDKDSNMNTQQPPKTLDIGSDKLTLYKDIRYGRVPEGSPASDRSSDRLLDIYIPTSSAPVGGYPVFLFVHGGGFSGGDKGSKNGYDYLCKEMAERGYAVVSINYYLTMKYEKVAGVSCSSEMKDGLPASGKFHPLVQLAVSNASDDATSALTWIKSNAKSYKLNTDFVTVCGGSAGSMTVLHLAYISGQKVLPIKAVVNLWGGVENPSKIAAPAAPMLTYHGDKDELINVDYGHALQKQMEKIGCDKSTLHILVNKGHAQYTYIAQNRADEIDAFIREVM